MIVATTWERKPFTVKAIRVTLDNMWEVADWCNGRYMIAYGGSGRPCIEVKLGHDERNKPKYSRAYIGDWVTLLPGQNSFQVYRDKSFLEAFQQVVSEMEKRSKMLEAIEKAMHGNKWGMGIVGERFTSAQILQEVIGALEGAL